MSSTMIPVTPELGSHEAGFSILAWRAQADEAADQWCLECAAVFARLFEGPWCLLVRTISTDMLHLAARLGIAHHVLVVPEGARARAHADLLLAHDVAELAGLEDLPAALRLAPDAVCPDGALGFAPGNPDEIGAALAWLATTPRLRASLAQEVRGGRTTWAVEGPFDSSFSLAIVNRELAKALDGLKEEVALDGPAYRAGRTPDWRFLAPHPRARDFYARHEMPPAVLLANDYPPRVAGFHGTRNVLANYAWEESGFPSAYVSEFNWRLNLVTVCSPLVKKILRDNGVHTPIAVVGNGVDHLLQTEPRALDLDLGSGFRFLHVSSCFPRKGPDVLLNAYGSAFRANDDVTLVIKTFPNEHQHMAQEIAARLATDPGYPRVVLIDEDLREEQVAWLYTQCHAFVLPSRAEGFGLPVAEATLAGLPVIVTGFGGHRFISEDDYALATDYAFAYSESHLGLFDSAWVEPDADNLTRLLRAMHALPDVERRAMAARAREQLLATLTWRQVAERTRTALAGIAALPALPGEPLIGWISTWNSRCGIATYSESLAAEIPHRRLRVYANRDAEALGPDPGFVTRCWTRGQKDATSLLRPIVEAGCGAVVVQWHPAFLPVRTLGELIAGLAAAGIPCYLALHNTAELTTHATPAAVRESLAPARRLLVHAPGDLNRLKALGLVENVTLFPHGVYATAPTPAGLKASMGLEGKRVVASFGFLMPHKGIRALIRAAALLREQEPNLHLLLVNALFPSEASATELAACEQLAEELGMTANVTLVPDFLPESEALALLSCAELVVYAYQHTLESASGAVRMGIASGRPVAATPLPIFDDVAEAIEFLPGITPEQLAEGMQRLLARLDDPAQRDEIESNTARWRAAHQWPTLCTRLLGLIDGEANDPFPSGLLPP